MSLRDEDKPAAAGKPDKWIGYNPTQAEETEVCCLWRSTH